MKLKHKHPCGECPWRKKAPAGWLGGFTAEHYTDAVRNNEVPACHNKDFGPESDKTAMCVGALAVMSNSCVLADKTPGGLEARAYIGRRQDVFQHYTQFYEYHAGKPYLHPLLRDRA